MKKEQKDPYQFWHRKLTLNVRIFQFLTVFTQLSARPKKIWGYFLVLSIKDVPVKFVEVCGKSVIILLHFWRIHTSLYKKRLILYRLKFSFSEKATKICAIHCRPYGFGIYLQSLTIAIIFELFYYINGYFRVQLTSMNIHQKCHVYLLY